MKSQIDPVMLNYFCHMGCQHHDVSLRMHAEETVTNGFAHSYDEIDPALIAEARNYLYRRIRGQGDV